MAKEREHSELTTQQSFRAQTTTRQKGLQASTLSTAIAPKKRMRRSGRGRGRQKKRKRKKKATCERVRNAERAQKLESLRFAKRAQRAPAGAVFAFLQPHAGSMSSSPPSPKGKGAPEEKARIPPAPPARESTAQEDSGHGDGRELADSAPPKECKSVDFGRNSTLVIGVLATLLVLVIMSVIIGIHKMELMSLFVNTGSEPQIPRALATDGVSSELLISGAGAEPGVRAAAGEEETRQVEVWVHPRPSSASDASSDRVSAVLLFVHGNCNNLADTRWLFWTATALARAQRGDGSRSPVAVVAMDYSGFGRLGGEEPSAEKCAADLASVFKWTLAAFPAAGAARTVVVGHSLGGAVVLAALASGALSDPALPIGQGVPEVSLVSTFASVPRMVAQRAGGAAGAFLSAVMRNVFDSEAAAARVRSAGDHPRVTLFHGEKDEVIPPEEAARLGEILRRPAHIVPSGTHSSAANMVCSELLAMLHRVALEAEIRQLRRRTEERARGGEGEVHGDDDGVRVGEPITANLLASSMMSAEALRLGASAGASAHGLSAANAVSAMERRLIASL